MAENQADDSVSAPPASDDERQMAAHAAQLFHKSQYEQCISLLDKLISSRGQDSKVLLNKAIAEYYRSGFCKTDEYKKIFTKICSKAVGNLDIAKLDDVDQCVFYINHAINLYHTKQYNQAIAIVDKSFQFVEPMEENLSKKILFLLVELSLLTHQPEKAMGVLNYIEKSILNNGKSNQSPDKETKDEQNMKEASNSDLTRTKVALMKTRCCLMQKSLKACKREIKGLMNTQGLTTPIVYLKSNFEYLRCNYRKAIKMLNSSPQPPKSARETGEHVPMMYYNNLGVIHFHMRKHNLGMFYCSKAMEENIKVTQEFNKLETPETTLSGRPVHTVGISRHHELLYNMGIQLLHCGKPTRALECLIEVVQEYQSNPRLWLRMAECCIQTHRESNDDDRKLEKRMNVINGAVGAGIHRKLVLGSSVNNDKLQPGSSSIPNPSLGFASMCLKNALTLLPNESSETTETSSDDSTETKPSTEVRLVPAPPGNPMRPPEVANLRCSILSSSAYVSLCLHEYVLALHYADMLLKQPRLSGALRYLGHMYMAEALVAMDRIADAVDHLNPEGVTDITTTFPEHKQEQSNQDKNEKNGEKESEQSEAKDSLYPWTPKDVPKAKAIMQYNLATAHTIRGEHEKALDNLSKATQANVIGLPLPAQMYYLKLYLELMEGHKKKAQSIIKDHFGHV